MTRRLSLFRGWVQVYIEPRDLWIGVFLSQGHVYVCPLPTVVIRVDRDWSNR
jgi:hypothetical protein